jgi:aminopeptidase-like protein
MALHEIPSGTQVFDWTVPKEWRFREARIIGPDGAVVVDAARSNLHVVSHSVPFRGRLSLEALQPHLHSLPDRPHLVPYRASFFREGWGFCLAHDVRSRLLPGEYDVLVDAELVDGSLTYGEMVLPGTEDGEVLVSTHVCHPSLANDNLSGMVVAATLARLLAPLPRRYTYRIVFVPALVGAVAWLWANRGATRRIRHGLVLSDLGDPGPLQYKRSRRGKADVDRAVANVLVHSGAPHVVSDFTPHGADERQYCSPGFDLPVGALSRTPSGECPECHTSADDAAFVSPAALADSLGRLLEIVAVLEGDRSYLNLSPFGEPQLGRRGLLGGGTGSAGQEMALLWVLNQSDGRTTLLDVAERAGLPFRSLREAADALVRVGLLAPADAMTEG